MKVIERVSASWRAPRPTISDGMNGQRNSLGIVRLTLAVLVILAHAFPLGGWGEDPAQALFKGQENSGTLAVLAFFAISGYLIAKSGRRHGTVVFFWHRVLRILPAYWVALGVAAFIVAPLWWIAAGRDLGSYFAQPGGWAGYLLRNSYLHTGQFGILDVFSDTPWGSLHGSIMNGSLWSLEYEFFCYLIIGALVALTVMARPRLSRIAIVVLTVFLALVQVGIYFFGINLLAGLPIFGTPTASKLMFAFLVGSLLAVFSRSVKIDGRVAAVAAVLMFGSLLLGWFHVIGIPAMAYLCLWLAVRLPAGVQWIGQRNDYSYGVYVYGFLVEQSLASAGVHRLGYLPYVALALVVTAGCAWLSWHLIEKHALALKDRGPGRGVAYWVERIRPSRGAAPEPAVETAGA